MPIPWDHCEHRMWTDTFPVLTWNTCATHRWSTGEAEVRSFPHANFPESCLSSYNLHHYFLHLLESKFPMPVVKEMLLNMCYKVLNTQVWVMVKLSGSFVSFFVAAVESI